MKLNTRALSLIAMDGKSMFRISTCSRILKSIFFSMVFATLAAAQVPAGPNRPAAVPGDFIITPFGYFHPSCVNHLAKGDVLLQDEKAIQHTNGTSYKIPVCSYPHYKADGEEINGEERAANPPTIGHAYVEDATITTSTSSYGELWAYWNVPPSPVTNDGQTLYLFPGLEDYKDVVTIIQPVLGWNSDYASAWGIASWNCCVNGAANEATPEPVNTGDVIWGYMFDTCAAGTLSCSSWDIVTWDLTTGKFSELLDTSSYGQTFNWAFAGALEVYNIVQCGDYPNSNQWTQDRSSFSFYNLALFNDHFVQLKQPAWKIAITSGLSPACNYGGSLPTQLTLNY
jgi:hypothetical protein